MKELNENTIANALEQIAAKLGTKTDELLKVVKSQVKVEFGISLVWIFIQTVIVILSVIFWHSYLFPYYFLPDNSVGNGVTILVVLGTLLCTGLFLGCGIDVFYKIETCVTLRYNPDYWALEQILSMLKAD